MQKGKRARKKRGRKRVKGQTLSFICIPRLRKREAST